MGRSGCRCLEEAWVARFDGDCFRGLLARSLRKQNGGKLVDMAVQDFGFTE